MKLKELAEGIGTLIGDHAGDLHISGITHDSRNVQQGTMFVAIEGAKADGHRYIGCATQLGALCIVTHDPKKVMFSVPILKVENPREAMALLARRLYGYPDLQLRIVGVTGTNGKTTSTFLINHLLKPLGKSGRLGTLSYFNGFSEEKAPRTTPESNELYQMLGEMRNNGCRYAAIEISSHGLDYHRVLGIELQYGIFTNLSQDHLDFHGDMESYFRSKCKLFKMIRPGGTAIINFDDSYGRRVPIPEGVNLIRFGMSKDVDLQFDIEALSTSGSRFSVKYQEQRAVFDLPLMGKHNIYNFLGAVAVSLAEGRTLEEMIPQAKAVLPVAGRCETLDLGQDFGVVVDYAHSPDALEKVLKACQEIRPNRLIVVFGAGGDRDRGKRPEMGAVVDKYADIIVLTSDNPRNEDPQAIIGMVEKGIHRAKDGAYQVNVDRRQAIHDAIRMAKPGDLVLLAGKGHETTQEIRGKFYPFNDREVASHYLRLLGRG